MYMKDFFSPGFSHNEVIYYTIILIDKLSTYQH